MSEKSCRKPNIIFILIDDMGWSDLSCYGSSFYETPHIDRLAAEGMFFTDAYAACPVCSPTRASIMSGKYPARIGLTNYIGKNHPSKGRLIDAPYVDHLPLEEKSIASCLKEGGYNTWHIGKWHLGGGEYYPENHGFDVNVAGCHCGGPPKGYFSPYRIETLEDGPEGEYLTDRLTDDAIRLIRENDEKPFFLNLWHYTVHTPIQAKTEDIEKYKAKAERMGLTEVKDYEVGEFYPCDHKKNQRIRRRIIQSDPVYAAMIDNLDQNIGRLLDCLEETGKADNTIIIFTSDNGGLSTSDEYPTCNAPLSEGKGWMYEGGVRAPMIIKWPGVVSPASKCSVSVTSPDLYPTFLDMAGLPLRPDQHIDGVSFMPLLQGKNCLDREAIYWHYPHYGNQGGTPGSSIRMGDYKLIEFFEDGHVELYNLKEDIGEQNNLAEEEPELANKMQKMLAHWRCSIDAKIPLTNPDFQPRHQE